MATKERTTYISIPPPPLPEFYMKKKRDEKESSSSSISAAAEIDNETFVIKETVTPGCRTYDGTYDGKPGVIPSTPFVTVPPPRHGNEVPPLAIYHICRICLRPRSSRYHREHPIPIDGLPPPPGICRRCRVTTLEETKKVAEVVVKSESNPTKIGCITPFIPDDDIVSNAEMRRMRAEKYLRGRSSGRCRSRHRSKSRKDIVYSHVKVVDAPDPCESGDEEVVADVVGEVWAPRKRKVVFTSQDAIQGIKDAPIPQRPTAPKLPTSSMQVQPTIDPPSTSSISVKREALRKRDSAKASVSTRASSTSGSGSKSTVRASAKVSMPSRPAYAESDMRKVARHEIEQYAKAMQLPEQRHAEIRRIAREEIERYRQAERKLEAHPDGYAHGKLVPVERLIDVERDIAEAMPWTQAAKKETSVAKDSSTTKSTTAQRDFAYEATSENTNGKTKSGSEARSWGAGWRRELSIERRSERDAGSGPVASQKSERITSTSGSLQTTGQESKTRASARSQQAVDRIQESDSLYWSSQAEPYIVDVSTQLKGNQNNVSRPFEEIDLPSRSRAASYRREEYSQPSRPGPERGREMRSDPKAGDSAKQVSLPSQRAEKRRDDRRSEATLQSNRKYWHDEDATQTTAIRSSKQDASGRRGSVRTELQSQYSPPVFGRSAHASTHSRVTFQEDQASDKTRWSRKQRMAEEGRAGRVLVKQDLPYPEDNVMPDHSIKPARGDMDISPRRTATQYKSSSKEANSDYVYVERTVQPADGPRGSRPFGGHPPDERIETEETYLITRHPRAEDPPSSRRQDQGGRRTRESDESKHIKFNKKVEISPTPPGSDASSSEFRSFRSIGAKGIGAGNGRQMDGNEDTGRPADITGEYERRGRTRSRDSKTKHFHEQEIIYERPDGEWVVRPKQRRKGGGSDRQAMWVAGSLPLERPLSESPSREELISSSRNSKSDGCGPYREQTKVTDSMHAEDGSPGGRAWKDAAGGSMHSSIGQAAQVFW